MLPQRTGFLAYYHRHEASVEVVNFYHCSPHDLTVSTNTIGDLAKGMNYSGRDRGSACSWRTLARSLLAVGLTTPKKASQGAAACYWYAGHRDPVC